MTTTDSSKLIEHLKAKWQNRPCPMCGQGNWTVQDKVFELREFHDGAMVIGGSALVPIVPVTCANCGNTVLINAIFSKIVSAAEKKDG